jgi:hypothetical protein
LIHRAADERIEITFLDPRAGKDGIKVKAKVGDTLLEVAREHDLELGESCFTPVSLELRS